MTDQHKLQTCYMQYIYLFILHMQTTQYKTLTDLRVNTETIKLLKVIFFNFSKICIGGQVSGRVLFRKLKSQQFEPFSRHPVIKVSSSLTCFCCLYQYYATEAYNIESKYKAEIANIKTFLFFFHYPKTVKKFCAFLASNSGFFFLPN